jgi:hypothetical protein
MPGGTNALGRTRGNCGHAQARTSSGMLPPVRPSGGTKVFQNQRILSGTWGMRAAGNCSMTFDLRRARRAEAQGHSASTGESFLPDDVNP